MTTKKTDKNSKKNLTLVSQQPSEPVVPEEIKPQQEVQELKPPFDPNKELKFGILAGLKLDDGFLFEIFGTQQTLVNLLGLRDYIQVRIDAERNKKLGTGDALTASMGQQLAQILAQLTNKLDKLVSILDKPTNQL